MKFSLKISPSSNLGRSFSCIETSPPLGSLPRFTNSSSGIWLDPSIEASPEISPDIAPDTSSSSEREPDTY